jgi:hypothetical protein
MCVEHSFFADHRVGRYAFLVMTRAISFAVGLLVVLALSLFSFPGRAEPPNAKAIPVYVLSIWTEDADDEAEALTQALRWRVRQAPGWSLLESGQSFETLSIALKCPPKPDAVCLKRIGDQLKADHYIWGTMERRKRSSDVSTELHLWARGRPDVDARGTFADSLKDADDESLRAIAAGLFGKLTGGGLSSPAPTPPASVVAAAPTPTPTPSVRDPEPTAPLTLARLRPASLSPEGSEPRLPVQSVLAYSAFALGAGFLVASAIEAATWISDSNRSADDRKSVPKSVTDVCTDQVDALARDACARSKDAVTASTLGWIFVGVGAAFVGTGIWLIATDTPKDAVSGSVRRSIPRAGFDVLPTIGARGGAVDVLLTF